MWEAVYRGLKGSRYEEKDKTDIDSLITGLRKAQDGRQLTIREFLSIIVKMQREIDYRINSAKKRGGDNK